MAPTAAVRFTRIYEEHYAEVLAYCARRVNRTEAEDVASEVDVSSGCHDVLIGFNARATRVVGQTHRKTDRFGSLTVHWRPPIIAVTTLSVC
jgi:hypothetical protein